MYHVRRSQAAAVLLAALLALPAIAAARHVRIHSPNGSGSDDVPNPSRAPVAVHAPAKHSPIRDNPAEVPMVRGGNSQDDGIRPSWHSILPGMFR